MEDGSDDLAALDRVYLRLISADETKLSGIFDALLPKLLDKLAGSSEVRTKVNINSL